MRTEKGVKKGYGLCGRLFISNVSTDFQFKVPATKDEISQIKERLNVELPNDLSSLLNETNGVFDEYDCLFHLVN